MKFTYTLLSLFVALSAIAQTHLEKELFGLPDVIFTKIETPEGYESAYKLMIKQPMLNFLALCAVRL